MYFSVMTICLEKRDTYMCETDIQTQKNQNIHIHDGTTKDDFAEMRNKRDAGLSMPKLILPSIQINMKAGQFPNPKRMVFLIQNFH